VRKLRGVSLQVDGVMGDAESAQFLGLSVPAFAESKTLMCFFHVLYNVRIRVQHLPMKSRLMIMASIVDMHFAKSLQDFKTAEIERY
jgi:hypothetical protein